MPASAIGISAGITIALKMIAEITAGGGRCKADDVEHVQGARAAVCGRQVVRKTAGRTAKYMARSLAIENVGSAPG